MIIDTVDRLPLYETLIPNAGKIAVAYIAQKPDEAGVEVREKSYQTKPDQKRRFEVHFKTIDLMIARTGAEMIHICSMRETRPAEYLPNNADGRKLDSEPKGNAVKLEMGYFCAIYPGEAHMVGGQISSEGASLIEKWVVKVPAPVHFCVEEIV